MIEITSSFQGAFAALHASLYFIMITWVIVLCLGLVVFLWNRNSRLREENHDLRIRTITAEAALAFAQQLSDVEASNFLWEYRSGRRNSTKHSDWPPFLHARLAAAMDWRS